MKSPLRFTVLLLVLLTICHEPNAQSPDKVRISKVIPYHTVASGQILQLHVEGLDEGTVTTMLPVEDFEIEVTQDGVSQSIKPRVVAPTMTMRKLPDGTMGELIRIQHVSFVVPSGLHPGTAEVRLSYRDQKSDAVPLTILERPLRPFMGTVSVMTINPADLPKPGTRVRPPDWRLERDSKAEVNVSPLVDPDDPNSAILIRFKQGNNWVEATAKVVHRPRRTEQMERGVRFEAGRDVLEVDVPAALSMGPAEIEIKARAAGKESDPAVFKVQIVDPTRSAEAPAENAPRIMAATPQRIGAGQTLMLAIDYLRTLKPDPAQTLIMVEQGTGRYVIKPDQNTANHMPNWTPDQPVMLMARPSRQLIGKVQVRVFNALRGEQGGLSAPQTVEIVDEVLPPEVTSVSESTDADLAQLRQMYEIQRKANRPFSEYDPERVYFTVRGGGFDPNPNMIRVTLEQNGKRTVLTYADSSLYGGTFLILRVPKGLSAGSVNMTIENRGAESFSVPVTKEFRLSKPS